MNNRRYSSAVQHVGKLISKFNGVRVLTAQDLSFYNEIFCQGWELPGLCGESNYKLRLLLPNLFPYYPPRMAVWPTPPMLAWPHLEKYGLLCLLSDSSSHSIDDPKSVVIEITKDAIALVQESLAGTNVKHFEDEFQNYWIYGDKVTEKMTTICLPEGPSRWLISLNDKSNILIGEDKASLIKWIENCKGKKHTNIIHSIPIPLIWLPRALRPVEYPSNVGALLSILNKMRVENNMILQMIQDHDIKYKRVLLGFAGKNGVGFAGLCINKAPKSINYGFRGQPPKNVLLTRYKAVSTSRAIVYRMDGSWIHGRDHNPKEGILKNTSVIIFGTGSVGSAVAKLLAKSGVGKIMLVDPEIFTSENIGRHVLGATSIGKKKATELSSLLSSHYPHLDIEGFPKSCNDFIREMQEKVQAANLIVSTIGIWSEESSLNALAIESGSFPPVLYGWTEAHAIAGHALVFYRGQGCLHCIMDYRGKPKIPVATWPEKGTLRAIPACGGHFQPYGAIELSHIQGLIADLALEILLGKVTASMHRVWIGQHKIFEYVSDGSWNSAWIEKYGDPGMGGMLIDVKFSPDIACPECGGSK